MTRLLRKVIHISALDSPNVQEGLRQQAQGLVPDNRIVVPGVVSWQEFQERLKTWDKVRVCIGVHGQFYQGEEVLLYPPDWLDAAEARHDMLAKIGKRIALAMGIDTGQGSADTVWTVIDRHGIIAIEERKTPDAHQTLQLTMSLMARYSVPADSVVFDAGGGGHEIACFLRARGHRVRTVGFGESVSPEKKVTRKRPIQAREEQEERVIYKNRRAQMYGDLRDVLNPAHQSAGTTLFAIPREYHELRRQLAPLPLLYDGERRMWLPPKNKKTKADQGDEDNTITMTDLIGRSPDHSDSLVLALYAINHPLKAGKIGSFGRRT